MTPAGFRHWLSELRRTRDESRFALLIDLVQDELVQCDWANAEHLRELEDLLNAHGERIRPELTVRPPGVGESLLLLFDRAMKHGSVHRLSLATSRAPVALSMDATAELDRVRRGLLTELGRACRSIPHELLLSELSVYIGPDVVLDGGSFGLSLCVALVSAALGRAPSPDMACSAAVDSEGKLRGVCDLPAKLDALPRQWPAVRKVVVAADQDPVDVPAGLEMVRVATLAEGLAAFGLEIERLGSSTLDDHVARVEGFSRDNQAAFPANDWRRLAWRALESAEALATDDSTKGHATKSRAWAALFFLHAGDPGNAVARIKQVSDADAETVGILAWKRVIEGTTMIDEDPETALAITSAVVELSRGNDEIRGQALGTHGRALVHASRPRDAESFLRDAVAHHERVAAREVPRSLTYLATCLRRQGRCEEAFEIANDGLARAIQLAPRWRVASSSTAYLELERGRCLAALGRHEDAQIAFQRVVDAYRFDHDYPRSAALRGLASSRRALGDIRGADVGLGRCVEVAKAVKGLLGAVAAMALADVLVEQAETALSLESLRSTWCAIFPSATTRDQIKKMRDRFVY